MVYHTKRLLANQCYQEQWSECVRAYMTGKSLGEAKL